jgi:hypothetical protein
MHFLDHLLATCAAHIDIVEEKDGSFGSTSMRSFSGFGSTSLDTPIKGVGYTTPNAPPVSVPSTLSATQIEDQVYQFLLSGKSTEWGFSKSENDINKAVETLLDDARIYDTGDEMHFKAIE